MLKYVMTGFEDEPNQSTLPILPDVVAPEPIQKTSVATSFDHTGSDRMRNSRKAIA